MFSQLLHSLYTLFIFSLVSHPFNKLQNQVIYKNKKQKTKNKNVTRHSDSSLFLLPHFDVLLLHLSQSKRFYQNANKK